MSFGSVMVALLVSLGLVASGGPVAVPGLVLLGAVLFLLLRDILAWLAATAWRAGTALWRSWRSYRVARERQRRHIKEIEREMAAVFPFSADFEFWALELHSAVHDRPRLMFAFLPEPAKEREAADELPATTSGSIRAPERGGPPLPG